MGQCGSKTSSAKAVENSVSSSPTSTSCSHDEDPIVIREVSQTTEPQSHSTNARISKKTAASSRLSTSLDSDYVRKQCLLYFQTWTSLVSKKDLSSLRNKKYEMANLSPHVIRWEWKSLPPHETEGRLTGRNRETLLALDIFQTAVAPVKIANVEVSLETQQPVARCRVTTQSLETNQLTSGYVEFTFNEAGEIIFIESWPLSDTAELDSSLSSTNRLSTHIVPVLLGGASSTLHMAQLKEIALHDKALSSLRKELDQPLKSWFESALLYKLKQQQQAPKGSFCQGHEVLETLQERKRDIEVTGRLVGVDLLFPPQDDASWARQSYTNSLGGAAAFASTAVRTVVFSAQT